MYLGFPHCQIVDERRHQPCLCTQLAHNLARSALEVGSPPI